MGRPNDANLTECWRKKRQLGSIDSACVQLRARSCSAERGKGGSKELEACANIYRRSPRKDLEKTKKLAEHLFKQKKKGNEKPTTPAIAQRRLRVQGTTILRRDTTTDERVSLRGHGVFLEKWLGIGPSILREWRGSYYSKQGRIGHEVKGKLGARQSRRAKGKNTQFGGGPLGEGARVPGGGCLGKLPLESPPLQKRMSFLGVPYANAFS